MPYRERLMIAQQSRFQHFHDGFGDFVLNRKNVFQFAIVALGPQIVTVRGVDKLRSDPEPLAGAANASFEDSFDVELTSDLPDVQFAAAEAKRRSAGSHTKAAKSSQCIDQFFSQPVAEIVLF